MARKPRDYAAEYARQKSKARAAGYQSVKQYKKARKVLGTPRNASPISHKVLAREPVGKAIFRSDTSSYMANIRRENQKWSDGHSRNDRSLYNPDMTDEQAVRYHDAYVERLSGSRNARRAEKMRRLHDYLVPDHMTEEQWKQEYQALR